MTNLFNSITLTQKRLLILVRNGLWGKLTDSNLFDEISHSDWEEIMELAAIQGVFGIAYDGIKSLPQALHPPKDILIEWALGVKEIEKRHYHQIEALQSLSTLFKENDIRCLLLKGPGIGLLYPVPEHRESGDLDIYLFGDYARCNYLMEERKIIVDYEDEVHSKFFIHSIPVENHSSFLFVKKNQTNREYEIVLKQELTKQDYKYSEDFGVWIPSLSFNLLFLFNHAVRHFLISGIVLRQVCDWAMMLNQCRDTNAYQNFYETIKRFDLQRYADVFNFIATDFLGLADPPVGEPVKQDYIFAQKVVYDILNQKRISPVDPQSGMIKIFLRKVNGSIFLFRNRWKYEAINGRMFFLELIFRLKNVSQMFKTEWKASKS